MIFGKSRRTVALDLGSGHVKVVALDAGGARPRVTALGVAPLPPDAIVGGEVMDYHLVADALRSLREGLGFKPRTVSTSVSGRDVIVKRIKMDRMRDQEARQVIRWEAEQHVPFDIDSVNLDFEILDPDADGLQMEVLLVAAKKDLIDTRIRLLEEAGFETSVIDVDSFAVQTAFEHNYEHAPYGTFCLVNVGRETTNLSLVESGRPLLTRDLPVGERKFVEALGREQGLSTEEAERRLREQPPDAPATAGLAEVVESLVSPIERARSFLTSSEGSQSRLDEVVLSGGGATLPGVQPAISARLGCTVTVLDPLREVDVDASLQPSLGDPASRSMLSVVVGLGLRGKE